MDITREHRDVARLLPLYRAIDDVLRGEEHIKSLRHLYLPYTSGMQSMRQMVLNKDPTLSVSLSDISALYDDYLTRAQFPSWTEDALLVMSGLVSQVVPTPKVPKEFNYIIENSTTDGFSLTELFKRICYYLVRHGKVTIVADVDSEGKAYFSLYDGYSEYNWDYRRINQRKELSMVAFKEWVRSTDDPFNQTCKLMRRAYVVMDGLAKVIEYDEESATTNNVADFLGMPSRPIGYIPAIRISAIDNVDESINPPLLPICRASIKAYVLSADLYSGLHRSCHPQLYVTGVDESPVQRAAAQNNVSGKPLKPNPTLGYTGAGTVWTLPNGATAGYVEPQGTGMQRVSDEIKKQRTSALEAGAKVMDVGEESGKARNARQNDQYSTLYSIIKNAAKAIEQALRYAYDMTSVSENKKVEESIQFEVPSDFGRASIDATTAAHLMSAAERGAISFDSYWTYVATGKIPERTFEQEREIMDKENIELKPIAGMVQVATGKDTTPKAAKPPAPDTGDDT